MPKQTLLFAPCAFNLAETSRMVEIAKAIERHPAASKVFDIHFISDGGDFERMIEKHGFALTRMEPRLTKEKIEFIAKVDRGEKFAPAFTDAELIQRVDNEIACLKQLKPAAVVTGSYVTIPVTCRVLETPLVWVVQSTWLPDFFCHGAGMTDYIRPAPVESRRRLVRAAIHQLLDQVRISQFGSTAPQDISGFRAMTRSSSSGAATLPWLRSLPSFPASSCRPSHYFIGPLIPQDEFPLPPEIATIPRDKPLIYFAMGSSGTPEIVAKILESFEGKPYRVIAPVKFQLGQVPGVRIPANVLVTDWVPAVQVNKMADLAVIHGGIGTVMAAALAGKPVVGVGMQMEQVANLACLERLGFAIRVPKSKDPSRQVQAAIQTLLHDEQAKAKAAAFAKVIAKWDGPELAAEMLLERYGGDAGQAERS